MTIFNNFIINFFLFCLGLLGIILNKQNIMIIIISMEIILLSINLNFIFFSIFIDDLIGQLFSFLILIIAAAESTIGLALIIIFFKINKNISIYKINLLSL